MAIDRSRWASLAVGFVAIATLFAPRVLAQSASRAEQAWQQGSVFYDRQDYRHALIAYQEAASLGNPRAMTVLGTMYRPRHRPHRISTTPIDYATM